MHIYQAGGRIWIHVYMDVQKLSSNHNCLHFREVRYVQKVVMIFEAHTHSNRLQGSKLFAI